MCLHLLRLDAHCFGDIFHSKTRMMCTLSPRLHVDIVIIIITSIV